MNGLYQMLLFSWCCPILSEKWTSIASRQASLTLFFEKIIVFLPLYSEINSSQTEAKNISVKKSPFYIYQKTNLEEMTSEHMCTSYFFIKPNIVFLVPT